MNKKLRLSFTLILVTVLFFTFSGTVAAAAAKPPPKIYNPQTGVWEEGEKEQIGPRCDFTGDLNDNPADKETCELGDGTVTSFGQSADVSVVVSPYYGDLPNPMNGMPRLGQALGVELFSEGSVGGVSVCFIVPEGKEVNISFWDVSQVPNVESILPTILYNGMACAWASQTGVYSPVENLPF
jgi:hypothetical protein